MANEERAQVLIRVFESDVGKIRIPADPEKETIIIIHEDESQLSD